MLCWDGTASLALHFGGTVESFLPLFTGVMMKSNLYGARFKVGRLLCFKYIDLINNLFQVQTADRLEASCHHVLVYARECFEKTRILPSKASRNCHQIRVYALGVSPHTASLCRFAVFEYNPTSLYASPIQAPPLLWARIA